MLTYFLAHGQKQTVKEVTMAEFEKIMTRLENLLNEVDEVLPEMGASLISMGEDHKRKYENLAESRKKLGKILPEIRSLKKSRSRDLLANFIEVAIKQLKVDLETVKKNLGKSPVIQ